MKMTQKNYVLRFCTPAFLGNAEQSGQWRTPPFKAQLRQ
jgi:CRISPR-associated protein Cmr1